MNKEQIRNLVEAALMTAGRPLSVDDLLSLFGDGARPERGAVREALESLGSEYESRGIELVEVASGFRIQARQALSEFLSRLWQERPPRYSRALMETLALVAYRQPITRGEIEDVRGVSVSTNIIRTLLERNWVRVVGHRDVPGRPAIYGTTREFLDYFGLKKLDELPSLAELTDIDSINVELDLGDPETAGGERSGWEEGGSAPEGATGNGPAAAEAPEEEREAEVGEERADGIEGTRHRGGEHPVASTEAAPAGEEEDLDDTRDTRPDEDEPGETEEAARVVRLPRG